MGAERLIALYEACGGEVPAAGPELYIVAVGDNTFGTAMAVSEQLRDGIPGAKVELNLGGGSFKSQLKRADKSGAAYAVVLGENEVARNEAGLKPLRSGEDQVSVALDELTGVLAGRLGQ